MSEKQKELLKKKFLPEFERIIFEMEKLTNEEPEHYVESKFYLRVQLNALMSVYSPILIKVIGDL